MPKHYNNPISYQKEYQRVNGKSYRKDCPNAYTTSKKYFQEYRKKYPHSVEDKKYMREYNLNHKYGISVEQKEQMLISQNNCCAICSNEFKNNNYICVDHNHITGKVRQLLCSKCNSGIGFFNDDINIIQNAVNYIKKWQ